MWRAILCAVLCLSPTHLASARDPEPTKEELRAMVRASMLLKPPAREPDEEVPETVFLDVPWVPSILADRQEEVEEQSRLKPEGKPVKPLPHRGLLAREIARQAFLIAARDELGLSTRDTALDESDSETVPESAFEVVLDLVPGEPVRVDVRRIGREQPKSVQQFTWGDSGPHVDYRALLVSAEAWSRGDAVALLKSTGHKDQRPSVPPKSPKVAGVPSNAVSYNELDRWIAVRRGHAAAQLSPGDSANLEALVRDYAVLGRLVDYHWTAAGPVCAARSLLYAQRLVQRSPRSARAIRHRAYAFALAGLHREALADMQLAETAEGARETPDWLVSLGQYCRLEAKPLAKEFARDESERASFAGFLGMLVAFESCHIPSAITVAMAFVERQPDCWMACDQLANTGQLKTSGEMLNVWIPSLDGGIAAKFAKWPEFPEAAREFAPVAKDPEEEWPAISWPELVAALDAAGSPTEDRHEVSWRCLGRAARQSLFQLAYREALHVAVLQSSDASGHVVARLEQLGDHPKCLTLAHLGGVIAEDESEEWFGDFIHRLRWTDLRWNEMQPLNLLAQRSRNHQLLNCQRFVLETLDETPVGVATLLATIRIDTGGQLKNHAAAALRASPHSPLELRDRVEKTGTKGPELVALKKEYARFPYFWRCVASRAEHERNEPELKVALDEYLALSPDMWGYTTLAKWYERNGDPEEGLNTLTEYVLAIDEVGIDEAKVAIRLARRYVQAEDWKKARELTAIAAQVGSAWSLEDASRVATATGDHEQAEEYVRSLSENYHWNSIAWWAWCHGTGRGDRAAAKEYAAAILAELDSVDGRRALPEEPWFLYEQGKYDVVARVFLGKSSKTSVSKMLGAILDREVRAAPPAKKTNPPKQPSDITPDGGVPKDHAKDKDNKTLRDEFLEKWVVISEPRAPFDPNAASHKLNPFDELLLVFNVWNTPLPHEVLKALREVWGADGDDDAYQAVDKEVARLHPYHRDGARYLVGRLMMSFQTGPAKRYLQEVVDSPYADPGIRAGARTDLNRLADQQAPVKKQ